MRLALEALHDLCATDDARRSFLVWQVQLAHVLQMPELSRPVKPVRSPAASGRGNGGGGGGGGGGTDSFVQEAGGLGRKGGVLERWLGKARRRSAVLDGPG
jgi:hypothetical protein